jgi:hypothetical protein
MSDGKHGSLGKEWRSGLPVAAIAHWERALNGMKKEVIRP